MNQVRSFAAALIVFLSLGLAGCTTDLAEVPTVSSAAPPVEVEDVTVAEPDEDAGTGSEDDPFDLGIVFEDIPGRAPASSGTGTVNLTGEAEVTPEILELLRAYGDTPETWALIEALQEHGLTASAAPGGSISGGQCQAEISAPRTLLVTCQDIDTGELTQTTAPIEGDLTATLETLAADLGGPGYESGVVDTPLCFWSETVQLPDASRVSLCPVWDYRYSELAATAAADFDTGRIAHHAPDQMVLGQPYFLELAIQPLRKNDDEAAVDSSLRSAVGTGLAPGSPEEALGLSFATIRAGNVMSVSALGDGFEILATTAEEQPVLPGSPTVWQWQVTPQVPGTPLLTFSVSETVDVNGRSLQRTVKTIPMQIPVQRLDDLLADTGDGPGGDDTAGRLPSPGPDTSPDSAASTVMGSFAAPSAENGGSANIQTAAHSAFGPDTEIAGCAWQAGADPDRQAMVLSNLAYSPPVSRLSVTHEDGERISEALSSVGFSVLQCEDLGQRQTVRALSMLGRMAKARTDIGAHPVTFFYYSGHGVNIDGTNFILPTDIPGASPDDIRDAGVSFEQIFNRVSSTVAPTSFVVFDACRTVMDDESKGLTRAYSPVGWASGVFQAFATEPGKTAADDGVYSQELAAHMRSLADPANVVFKRVQDAVSARTSQKQRPVYTDGTTGGDFYFRQSGG